VPFGWLENVVLSKGGRITLIKSTLFNVPTYFLSLFPILAGVAYCIKKLWQDFVGGIGEEFKYQLVNWFKVCYSIVQGGLRMRNLVLFN
jgi:hypothetical protein